MSAVYREAARLSRAGLAGRNATRHDVPMNGTSRQRLWILALVMAWVPVVAGAQAAGEAVAQGCGRVAEVATARGATIRYALAGPTVSTALAGSSASTASTASATGPPAMAASSVPVQAEVVLVLLPGGSGRVNLDDAGCPRALRGNWLVRSQALFRAAGFATALVDTPSDRTGDDGYGGFRAEAAHADDLARVIADVRTRTGASQVWLSGTSRGSISAANGAARLAGAQAPDGVVLSSIVTTGGRPVGGRTWIAQTVFDVPLSALRVPLLAIGHAEDGCVRSPAGLTARVTEATASARRQVVIVTGGPRGRHDAIESCEGRSPHGFIEQEAEVVAGIARFVRGGDY
jgi:hypothetical protein